MQKIKQLAASVALASLLLFSLPAVASADLQDFTVTDFTADYTLSNQDPQGHLDVTERISVDFTDNNHGILRALPESYLGHKLQLKIGEITSDSNAPTNLSTYDSNGNLVLKIGNPNQTVTGPQEYTLHYSENNVISFYNDHDELYWDVNGDQWLQPFTHVAATYHLPAGVTLSQTVPECFVGTYGVPGNNCQIKVSNDGRTITASAGNLTAGQTLTSVIGFNKGYFKPATWLDKLKDYAPTALKIVLAPLIAAIVCLYFWLKRGRDAKGTGIIVPQYDAPDGLKPLEVGTLIDFKVDNRDITATIIDLAVRGYIKITETKIDRKILGDQLGYTFELTKADLSDLNEEETKLMMAIFDEQMTEGRTVDLAKLKNDLAPTAVSIRKTVTQKLITTGYFRNNPLNVSAPFAIIGGLLFFGVWFGGIFFGLALSAGLILASLIIGFTAFFMASRTAKGVAAKEHIEGLKLYLTVAEADRLKMLQSPNAPYASGSHEPARTVQLFEKLLPYAIALGVENQWARQFEDLYKSPPDWFAGNYTTFNALYLTHSLSTGMSLAVNSAFASPSSSGSSGFGGGGFAGGGGGGGGGGGW